MRAIVSGACGRTGSLVSQAVAASEELDLTGAIEAPGTPSIGRRLCDVLAGCGSDAVVLSSLDDIAADAYDVIVDFSTPDQAVRCARKAAAEGKGLVEGTTGLTEAQLTEVHTAASKSAVVLASNMSVGANILFALVERMSRALGPDFDAEIVEAHHRYKLDAPSGTALTLAEIIARARGQEAREVLTAGRTGRSSVRRPGEIGIHSLRGGTAVGKHTVHFFSDAETLTIEHEALTRGAFAEGAVRAAVFVGTRPPGLYDMSDVLGLSSDDASRLAGGRAGDAGGGRR